ncbi:hypothetical protein [Rubritalea tangerina]
MEESFVRLGSCVLGSVGGVNAVLEQTGQEATRNSSERIFYRVMVE